MEKIFGPRVTQTQAPQNPNSPGITNNLPNNPPPSGTQQTAQTAPNGVVPQGGSDPANPQEKQSPLEQHKDLWKTPEPDKNATPPTSPEDIRKQMLEAAGKVDFSKVLDQEMLTKIAAGGEGAVQALVGVLNKTAQTVYGQSTVVAQSLIDKALNAQEAKFQSELPNLVKRFSTSEGILNKNPALSNPVVAPIVEAIQSRLVEKYPKASSQEIQTMAEELMSNAAELFNPKAKNSGDAGSKGKKDEDWESYLS